MYTSTPNSPGCCTAHITSRLGVYIGGYICASVKIKNFSYTITERGGQIWVLQGPLLQNVSFLTGTWGPESVSWAALGEQKTLR